MKGYGSKDIMRIVSLKEKSEDDYVRQLVHAFNMACAITEPGKAVARGNAAIEVFGKQSAVAQIFFERAWDLTGGVEVKPEASSNPLGNADDEYADVPIEQQPASRRLNSKKLGKKIVIRKTPHSNLVSLGKLNVIKGTGPKFSLYDYPAGTLEVWKSETETYRLIYTSNYESVYLIGENRKFKYDGNIKEWEMVDYIETEYVSNLAPLYGKSLMIFSYD